LKTSSFRFPGGGRTGRKLIWRVFLFSSLITLLLTALQLYLDFRADVAGINSFLESIQRTDLRPIAQSVWILDDVQVNLQLEGLIHRQDIVYAAVEVEDGPGWHRGSPIPRRAITATFPLHYEHHGKDELLGRLRVAASLEGVYGRLLRRVKVILLANGIKTFLVIGFALLIFQYMVTRHLVHMAAFVQDLEVHRQQPPLRLDRPSSRAPDELDLVVNGINHMRQRGYQTFCALREREQRLRLFFDSTEEAIFGVGLDGRCTFANQACLRLLGHADQREVLEKDIVSLVQPPSCPGGSGRRIRSLVFAAMRGERSVSSDEEKLCRGDGGWLPIALRVYPVLECGRCRGAVVFFADISEQQRLQHEKHLLARVVHQSPLSVVISDARGKITYVNPGFEKITGYGADEVVGRRPFFLHNDLLDPHQYRRIRATLRRGEQWRGRLTNTTRSGAVFNLDTVISAVRGTDGRVTNLVAVSRDITREMELQDQLHHAQKLEAIGKLSASIAHEFGNPLLGVRFAVRDIKTRFTRDSEEYRMMDLAERECDRMKKMIRDLQHFNRPTTGVRARFPLHDILDDILLFHRRFLVSRRIRLLKRYTGEPVYILAVEDQIRQVFVNLLLNAGEAMGREGGTITVSTEVRGKMVAVSIGDTGVGIRAEHLDHVFEPFFTTKLEVEGTGLGLPVSYGIVTGHGGDITVRSIPGRETVFTVTLPLA